MPIASGFSIQRNDIVDVAHRTQKETHAANSGTNTYLLKSKPDFTDKDWDWDIRLGETRVFLDRTKGTNIFTSMTASTEIEEWNSNAYIEGSTTAGEGGIKYVSSLGEFGALVFSESAAPVTGEVLEIKYSEAMEKFTGSDGGLFFQLAHDMCIHPYDSPEIFKAKFRNNKDFITSGVPTEGQAIFNGTFTGDAYQNDLSVRYNHDYNVDGTPAAQRVASKLWKVVTEHRETTSVDLSAFSSIDPTDNATFITLMSDFPLIEGDLGMGEFRVSINGRVLPRDDYVVSSVPSTRKTTFKLQRNPAASPLTWVADMAAAEIVVSYHWAKSLDVPYGALVGYNGLGPDQEGASDDFSWPKVDSDTTTKYWDYSEPRLNVTTGVNGFIVFPNDGSNATIVTSQGDGTVDSTKDISLHALSDARTKGLAKVSDSDVFYLTFNANDEFATPFKLVYPKPVSNNNTDVKAALRRITNKFMVESEKGVDLLSDSGLSFVNSLSPSGARKPQKWRIRFEWNDSDSTIKVNVATEYQLKDDMSISQPQGRDGIKSPVYREPGELCDVYKEPAIGKGANFQINTAKQQWFRRTNIVDELSQSYPMSYRITCTDHGVGLFLYDQAAVDQDDDYAWFVVQRHVDQTTGQPEFTEKSPVHCVYSPFKSPVDVSTLNRYYATDDLNDLSQPAAISDSLGSVLKSESPTIYIDKSKSIFNGYVNAIDFNSFGYTQGASVGGNTVRVDMKDDLYRGITGAGAQPTTLWSESAYTMYADVSTVTGGEIVPGRYINYFDGVSNAGGRVIAYNETTGELTFSASGNPITILNTNAGASAIRIGTSATGDVMTNGDFIQAGSNSFTSAVVPGTSSDYCVATTHLTKDLQVIGFNALPRRRDTAFTMNASKSPLSVHRVTTPSVSLEEYDSTGTLMSASTAIAAPWVNTADMAPSASGGMIFPENELSRMSTFAKASTSGTGVPPVPENISLADYNEGDSALLDILYNAQSGNIEKVYQSMVVALDDVEIQRDQDAYILTYDEWVQNGDPATVGRFMEMLDAAGVDTLGSDFKVPSTSATVVSNLLGETGTNGVLNSGVQNTITNRPFLQEKGAGASLTVAVSNLVLSANKTEYTSLLPGDVVWGSPSSVTGQRNMYMYDFFNKTLLFKYAPRSSATFSISMINYSTANPSSNLYTIDRPEDRNFPETNMNNIKTINRFVVREQDVLKPWDYHVSATMHEIDSHAIINPQEQLSITQDRNFVFSFPTQITSQRFYYPQSELDLICVSSADFSTQAGHVEINKYGDSDGINGTFSSNSFVPAGITGDEQTRYAGHTGPDEEKYVWRKNARKYEGMVSTLPNGNGMRIFMQVTGSSIRYSDVTEGKAPGSAVGT